jgi:predicted house-cleaning noncanonical NTP pyrophosphatase (MazG superfamily)
MIRQSGRRAEVRYVSGEELMSALAAKLQEEAHEPAEALDSRENLIEELADLTEVMSALMAIRGIDQRDVVEAARVKAMRRGRFESGAWLRTTKFEVR